MNELFFAILVVVLCSILISDIVCNIYYRKITGKINFYPIPGVETYKLCKLLFNLKKEKNKNEENRRA
jgi:hypothetical protein